MNRSRIRELAASAGYRSGMTQAIARAGDPWRKGRFLVLFYHRVNDDGNPFSIEATPVGVFQGQMDYLARHFRVLPLADIVRRTASGLPLPPRAAAVTFDDGYEDNYRNAYPVLRALGLPATIFLTTGLLETGSVAWFDRVLHAFRHTRRTEAAIPGSDSPRAIGSLATRRRAAGEALLALRRLPGAARLEAVERLVAALRDPDTPPEPREMLRWDQVREMSGGGIDFGAHTVLHPILSTIPLEEARREVSDSKQRIEAETGGKTTLFAYPGGKPSDISAEVVRLVAEQGFEAALTTVEGPNGRSDDRFLLRRVRPGGPDVASFALGMTVQYLFDGSHPS